MHDRRTLPLDYPPQCGHSTWIGNSRMERPGDVGVQGREGAAPSVDTDDTYPIERLLVRIVTGVQRHDRDRVAEADKLTREGLYMSF